MHSQTIFYGCIMKISDFVSVYLSVQISPIILKSRPKYI